MGGGNGWRKRQVCQCLAQIAKHTIELAELVVEGEIFPKIFTLLTQHFDTDNGRYVADWDDGRIAKETGMAPETVAEFRREAFGEIKEPSEIQRLRSDINALDRLASDNHSAIMGEVAKLRGQLAQAVAKLGIPA